MVLVIASGVVGVVVYSRYPRLITDHRAQATREGWLEEVLDLNERAIQLADQVSPDVHRFVLRSVERLRLGGSWREQLAGAGSDRGDETEQVIVLTESRILMGQRDPAVERLKQLLELLIRRNELTARVNRDVEMHARMQVWLYLHVPLTAALLAALLAHIVIVFLYH